MSGTNKDEIKIQELLPKTGLVYTEQNVMPVLCKPKILPLKSVTLEKLEKMQKEAEEVVKRQEEEAKAQERLMEQQREILSQETHSEPDVMTL